jgi:hypothetical protein
VSNREAASIISIFIIAMTLAGALIVRAIGARVGVRAQARPAQVLENVAPLAAPQQR